MIFQVNGEPVEGLEVFLSVNSDTESIALADSVVCSEGSIWRLYHDEIGQSVIPT